MAKLGRPSGPDKRTSGHLEKIADMKARDESRTINSIIVKFIANEGLPGDPESNRRLLHRWWKRQNLERLEAARERRIERSKRSLQKTTQQFSISFNELHERVARATRPLAAQMLAIQNTGVFAQIRELKETGVLAEVRRFQEMGVFAQLQEAQSQFSMPEFKTAAQQLQEAYDQLHPLQATLQKLNYD